MKTIYASRVTRILAGLVAAIAATVAIGLAAPSISSPPQHLAELDTSPK
jgi:hypothetical protein